MKLTKLIRFLSVAFSLVLVFGFFSTQMGFSGSEKAGKGAIKVSLMEAMQPPFAPVYVAAAKGYFEEEGLQIEFSSVPSGRVALDSVLGERVDMATMAETPPMLAGIKKQPLVIITGLEQSDKNAKILVRKDLGISKPSDLIGQKIATSIGTNAEFMMVKWLEANNIKRDQLTIINLSPADMVSAIQKGAVKAIFTWEPHITNAKSALGDKAEICFTSNVYREMFCLASLENYAKNNQEAIKAVLRALIKAEKFINDNPEESIKIVAPKVNMDTELLGKIWKYFDWKISFEKVYVDLFNAEGKWAIESGIAPKGATLPDFRKMFFTKPMEEVAPERVNM